MESIPCACNWVSLLDKFQGVRRLNYVTCADKKEHSYMHACTYKVFPMMQFFCCLSYQQLLADDVWMIPWRTSMIASFAVTWEDPSHVLSVFLLHRKGGWGGGRKWKCYILYVLRTILSPLFRDMGKTWKTMLYWSSWSFSGREKFRKKENLF